ncbi:MULTISPECIES: DUF4232 domain-containing protein [Amycolatopsis]|uniref:DUF4232 domain-containing protein n=1 Tax=Amycolatopsis thermalba TaxID=944492 RepID=A0ABY4P0P3_9PSEU|nr:MULTISPECIES: DUF4232 domain-containing protein [Amycolatopsis]OXM63386.1 hypothetical protein CF166_31525 [Amycolatopsis sp. KNN50.9b]UQS25832.1 DUF4232 domain-containing protein [Amycolatopsis thermalba]
MGGFRFVLPVLLCVAACSAPAPQPPPPPADCAHYDAGLVDAALGHRGFVLTLTNCGTAARAVSGYPDVQVLGPEGRVLDVRVERGTSYMAIDPGSGTFALAPGKSLVSVVSWANTVTDGEVLTGSALGVASRPGEAPQRLPVETDLGTTGEITVTAWAEELAR